MSNLKFFLSLSLVLALSTNVKANEQEPKTQEEAQVAVVEELAPETNVLEVKAAPRPECSDKKLAEKVVETLTGYQKEHPSMMQIERRRDILLRRNLTSFEEVAVEGFTSKQDFKVANAIIMTKINKGLEDSDLRLCKGKGGAGAAQVYILLYPVGEGNVGEIINLQSSGEEIKNLSFIYD